MSKPMDQERVNENAAEEKEMQEISNENTATSDVNSTEEETVVMNEDVSNEISENSIEQQKEVDSSEVAEEKPEPEKLDKDQIISSLTDLVTGQITDSAKNKIESLKHTFYKLKRIEIEIEKKAFVEAGNLEEDFMPIEDSAEAKLKELLNVYKEKKAVQVAEVEKTQQENLTKKQTIIERLKELIESPDDFQKIFNEFRTLQQQWKEIKQVPQSAVNDLWKDYQHYSEKFYDLLKINNEMRDYDFKKNLELKETLCQSVERLDEENDIISAFYQLQNFHQEWREIGPVAREFRETVWARFKKASLVVNKKYQEHFDSIRALEQRNLDEKTALCEEMETIDFSQLNTSKEWDAQTKKVIEAQEKWKTIGFASKRENAKIFERFRAVCDAFFKKKNEFYKGFKDNLEENLKKKQTLCEKVEALKESQEWKETTDKLIALQKEWKTIGQVPRKHSESLWKQFISACDYFFEQKNIHFSSQKTEETQNLAKKNEIISLINTIDETLSSSEAVAQLRKYIAEFNAVGFVPFKEKDKIYKEFRASVDKQFDRLKVDESERRLRSFKSNIASGERSKGNLFSEREKLLRNYDRLKSDIQTYENNIGFLSVSSKGGGGLVKEMERKIESLKEELVLIEKKIEIIDQNLEAGN